MSRLYSATCPESTEPKGLQFKVLIQTDPAIASKRPGEGLWSKLVKKPTPVNATAEYGTQ